MYNHLKNATTQISNLNISNNKFWGKNQAMCQHLWRKGKEKKAQMTKHLVHTHDIMVMHICHGRKASTHKRIMQGSAAQACADDKKCRSLFICYLFFLLSHIIDMLWSLACIS